MKNDEKQGREIIDDGLRDISEITGVPGMTKCILHEKNLRCAEIMIAFFGKKLYYDNAKNCILRR